MRATLVAVVLLCLLAVPALGYDVGPASDTADEPLAEVAATPLSSTPAVVKVAGDTVTGTVDWIIDALGNFVPSHFGAAQLVGPTGGTVELLGFKVAEYRDRSGYLDLLLTFEQEARGVGVSFEPFSGNNACVGVGVWEHEFTGYAGWHGRF